MALLHDATTRSEIEERVRSLQPTARGRWGKMTVDQMLWHVNEAMALSLGEISVERQRVPLPLVLMRFIVIKLPWPKGSPTHPDFVAKANYDFDGERDRLLRLVNAIVSRPIDDAWPLHPTLGRMTGREISQLMAKHLDHHLKQFGA